MKRKLALTLIAALAAVLTLTGAALATGFFNLFDFFGSDDERLKRIAPDTAPVTAPPEEFETENIGATGASFNSAYYDGRSMIVAFTLENDTRFEAFEPDEAMLARMDKEDFNQTWPGFDEFDRDTALQEDFVRAIDGKRPYGFVRYTIYPSDHCVTGDGVDLPPWREQLGMLDGSVCYMREFESPLPKAVWDRDSLDISIRMYEGAAYYWFDGTDLYTLYEQRPAGEITATVPRTDAVTRTFRGEGTVNGAAVRVEAQVSAVHATLTLECDGDILVDPETLWPDDVRDDVWYDFQLCDENGNALRMDSEALASGNIEVHYDGLGVLPDSLILSVRVEGEGDWQAWEHSVGEPITLVPVK